MKKLLFIAMLVMTGCYPARTVWLGMSEYELTSQHWNYLRPIESNVHRTVYSSCNYYGTQCTYFYFVGGRLVSYDQGEYVPDIYMQVK